MKRIGAKKGCNKNKACVWRKNLILIIPPFILFLFLLYTSDSTKGWVVSGEWRCGNEANGEGY